MCTNLLGHWAVTNDKIIMMITVIIASLEYIYIYRSNCGLAINNRERRGC